MVVYKIFCSLFKRHCILGCLAGGTSSGKLAMWNKAETQDESSISIVWKLKEAYDIGEKA